MQVLSPLRWTYDRATDTYSGTVVVNNTGATITGTLTLALTVPDASIQVVAPAATRVGNSIFVPIKGTFGQNQPVRFTLQVRNPNKVSLGSVLTGFLGGVF